MITLNILVLLLLRIGLAAGSPVHADDPGSRFDSVRVPLQNYIWPTDASMRVTSSFAEYRTSHFHGGIDISTNGVKGYKVFAARDGYVYKVRITPSGYGKMLFIRHDDGYVTCYAHLQGFNEEITKAVREEQYRRGTYSIDLTFDRPTIRVRQGDVVAYTGDSGFGPPHLHFEIRDESLNPLNPMLFQSFLVQDNIPPFIRRLMISPLTYSSTVDNGVSPKYFSRFPRRRKLLTIPEPVRVHGLIGIGVDAEDRSEGTRSMAGVHRIELYLDDSLTFAMELNRVPAEETKQIDLHYDYASIQRGTGRFQKLYIDTGNVLPFYFHKPAGTGIINTDKLAEGKHDYRVVCLDNSGNRAELRGVLLANHRPEIHMGRADGEDVIINGSNLESIEKCYVYGKRAFQPNWTQHTLIRGRFEMDASGMELPIDTRPYDVVKIIAESRWGSQSSPVFYFVKKPLGPARDVHISSDVREDHVRFTLTTPGVFTEAPTLYVDEGNVRRSVAVDAVDVNRYAGAYVPSIGVRGRCAVEVDAEVNGRPVKAEDAISLYVIPPDRGGSFPVDSGRLIVSYDSGAVYRPLCLQISRESDGEIYSLSPDDVLLNGGIRVSMKSGSENKPGLYFRGNGGWTLENSKPDSQKALGATLSRMLGDVAILNDDVPPRFGRLRVWQRKGILLASFRYADDLSGVDPDEIKMYLDGKLVIPEIDGEHRRVTFEGDGRLDRGRHDMRILMKDRAGNASEISRVVSVR